MKKTLMRLFSLVCAVTMFASAVSASAVSIKENISADQTMETLLQNAKEVETYYTKSGAKITVAVTSGANAAVMSLAADYKEDSAKSKTPVKSATIDTFECEAAYGNHLYAVTTNVTEEEYDMRVTYTITGVDDSPVKIEKVIAPGDDVYVDIESEDVDKGLTCELDTLVKSLSTVKPVMYEYYAIQEWA